MWIQLLSKQILKEFYTFCYKENASKNCKVLTAKYLDKTVSFKHFIIHLKLMKKHKINLKGLL